MNPIKAEEILFIINPRSGKRNPSKIIEAFKNHKPPLHYKITKKKKHLKKIIKAKSGDYKAFVAVGGDGTVNQLVKKLYKYDKILGVLPQGSGNGFARELGFKNDLKMLMRAFEKGETQYVDLLRVNDRWCMNMAGIGFDSHIAHLFHKLPKRGLISYVKLTMQSMFNFRPFEASIYNGKVKTAGKYLMISIANTRQFGNNAYIAPEARPNDGIYDVLLMKPMPVYKYLGFVIKMFRGTLKNSKYVEYHKMKSSTVIQTGFGKLHVDGEPKSFSEEVSIKLDPKKVTFIKTELNIW